jgi:hypothetical protein
MSTKALATAPTPDAAEPTFPPLPVFISFGYDTGFSTTQETLVLNWPKPDPDPPLPITITFQLDTETVQNFSFYDRGIVFQYPHDQFTIQPNPPAGTVSFTVNPPDPSNEVTAFRYAVLLQDNTSKRVCFFDPTVQNDPPGM